MDRGQRTHSRPPSPGPARPFRFPSWRRARLDNGLEILAAPIDRTPQVEIELLLDAGGQCDSASRPGLANFHAALLDEGTASRSSQDIARTIEQLGGHFGSGVDWDTAWVGCGLLADDLDAGLELVHDVVTAPTFPDYEIERLRAQFLAELERRARHPSHLAELHLAELIFGDSVYRGPLIGRPDTLRALDRDGIVAFHRRRMSPGRAFLLVSGDVLADQVIERAEALFGTWSAAADPSATVKAAPSLNRLTLRVVDLPEAEQTEIRVGHQGLPGGHPDYLAVAVMNSLLGGKFTSRINLNLREEHGYTYGAGSNFARRRGRGPFSVYAAVGTENAGDAVKEILSELTRIREEPAETAELAETQSYFLGVFPYTTQTLDGINSRLRNLAVLELPDDYYDRLPAAVAALTIDDIQRVARRHLEPERAAVVAVGPAAALEPQLSEIGAVEIVTPTRL